MMKSILLLFILALISVPHVSAESTWTVSIYPSLGTTTGNILILIRCTPYTGSTPLYLYVFYDDVCQIQRQASPSSNGVYTYQWDVKVKPPALATYTPYSSHIIMVRLEAQDGSATTKSLSYGITDNVPQGEWWKNLPKGYYDYLKGSDGKNGVNGKDGKDGIDAVVDYAALWAAMPNSIKNEILAKISINYSSLGGQINYSSLSSAIPSDTLAKLKGDAGAAGVAGRDADPILIYAAIIIGLVAVGLNLESRLRRSK